MSSFTSALDVEFIDGKNWRVTAPFRFYIGQEDANKFVLVPANFITDFASVPRGLWNLFPPTGGYGKAAVVHDYLYRGGYITYIVGNYEQHVDPTRAQADGILKDAMEVSGVGWFTRWAVYSSVRAGGQSPWNKGHDGSQKS